VTRPLDGAEVAARIAAAVPGAVLGSGPHEVLVAKERLLDVARFLYDDGDTAMNYLAHLTSVDCIDYFQVVYQLVSMRHNHAITLKTRAYGREEPVVPSVVSVWRGAENQEREVYDLMGVRFQGHPNLKRIMLWEGFEGHPLRKDFLLQRP
jgi:NADH-quinone oxidoreductase subunit C